MNRRWPPHPEYMSCCAEEGKRSGARERRSDPTCHARARGHPGVWGDGKRPAVYVPDGLTVGWIPAFAGMTGRTGGGAPTRDARAGGHPGV